MINKKRAFEVSRHGLSLNDNVFLLGGADHPDIVQGLSAYPSGTLYLRTNGTSYQKQIAGTWKLLEAGTADLTAYYTKAEIDALIVDISINTNYDGGNPPSIFAREQELDGGYTMDDFLYALDFGGANGN